LIQNWNFKIQNYKDCMVIHKSVLLEESLEYLNLKPGDVVVDATLGGGGHSQEILKKILPEGKLVALDRDASAIENFREKIKSFPEKPKAENWLLINENYSRLDEVLGENGISKINGIIADLGISSLQLDDGKRGLSFLKDGPLDMRLDQREIITAQEIVNNYPEKELEKILRDYGNERYSRSIARKITQTRNRKIIESTSDLVEIIRSAVPKKYQFSKIHFATRSFQALRMAVNQELEHLEKFLSQAIEVLDSGGRIAVITFHSGEDRIVKQVFRENARGCICPKEAPICRCQHRPRIKIIARKIMPSEDEIQLNPRSRSAKMRVAEKL
jgi:16S rRNA (cytosine1402-N4)-methyltransferase